MTWSTHSFSDGVDGARAVFRHSVEVTGEVAQLPEDALLKWACVYYLGKLTESGLKEAFSSLQGIHTFEAENAQIAASRLAMIEHAAPPHRKKITAFRKQELKPLEIGE